MNSTLFSDDFSVIHAASLMLVTVAAVCVLTAGVGAANLPRMHHRHEEQKTM